MLLAQPVNGIRGPPPPPYQSRLPAKKIAASRNIRPIPHPYGASASAVQNYSRPFCLQLIPFGYRVGRDPTSIQVTSSQRIHAPRPGLRSTPQRFSAGLSLTQPSLRFECGTGVESPLKSANRRPDGKGWTPGMAARGESRQDVELSRPQTAGREVSVVRSTDFVAGARGLIRGPRWPPYHVHRFHSFHILLDIK